MLGNFLKRMEMKSRQPEVAMKKVKEQAQARVDQAISERDDAIQNAAQQQESHQAEMEAKDNTIKELTERLSRLTQDDQQQE